MYRLKTIQTGPSGSVQNLAFTWDLVGNLSTRKDVNQSNLTEAFFYDNLYRLDYSQRNGLQNLDLSYDALGNIAYKSDVGTYSYDSTKKHQVNSTSNGWSFGYDDNGNMTSGRGATITWTSYNYPASIDKGSDTADFSYTPNRQYWRQISNYTSGGAATTIYVGGLLEKVTSSAGTDFRHIIRAGGSSIIVSRQSSGTNSVHYVTSDHLGSSSAITNSSGGILVNSSFDAFGKRRGSNWSGNPSAGDWSAIAATTRRGYTEHSMLDNLGLIHMNGRVHDPVIGRFLSADPFITEPLSTQNYNRYGYVENNPLSYTDPSGFKKIKIKVGFCVTSDAAWPEPEQDYGLSAAFGNIAEGYGFGFNLGFGVARGPDLLCGYRDVEIEVPDDVQVPTETSTTPQDSIPAWSACTIQDMINRPVQKLDASRGTNLYTVSHAVQTGIGEVASALGWPTDKNTDGTLVNPMTGYPMTVRDRQDAVALTALSVIAPESRALTPAARGLGNPFKGKTSAHIDDMFRKKGFEPRGPDPAGGKGGYINPQTNRSYHIDEANSFGEPPHVDVNRLRTYDGDLPKKKYPFGE